MPSTVRVTVFIAVYNGERFIERTIDSVLKQTLDEFELLIIDDCSTDKTREIVASYKDRRIRLEENQRNMGQPFTRNRGLALAESEYIAVLDADDVCEPERLQRSVQYLDAHPDVAAIGSGATLIDESDQSISVVHVPTDFESIRTRIFIQNCFIHPSITFRRSAVMAIGGYNPSLKFAQDYDLILRLSAKHRLANLSEPLVRYRIHTSQASQKKLAAQRRLADIARLTAYTQQYSQGLIDSKVLRPDVSLLNRMRGGAGTFSADCLYWARVNRAMRNHAEAAVMVRRAIVSAPLSRRAWRAARWALLPYVIPSRMRNMLRWYASRLTSRFGGH